MPGEVRGLFDDAISVQRFRVDAPGRYRIRGTVSTQDGKTRVTQQTGEPSGGLNQEPGSNFQVPGNNDIGLPYDNTEIPKTGPLGPQSP